MLVVTKLDRLPARCLTAEPSPTHSPFGKFGSTWGGSVHDPTDPAAKAVSS
jgi:hypothetical protein